MAKIGLNNFWYGLLNEDNTAQANGTVSYQGAKSPAKAISCSVSITNNSATLYADDAIAESDYSFGGGTVTIGIDREGHSSNNASNMDTLADLLGHDMTDGELVRNAGDTAPYVGLGRVVTLIRDGVRKYKVEFLHKVKFSEPNQEDNTKGENLDFATITIEGQIATLDNGDWSKAKIFDTKDAAVNYLKGLLAAPTP